VRIFIAGATGVLGRRVVTLLRDAGHEVTGHGSELDLFDAATVSQAVAGHGTVLNLATAIPSGARMALPAAWATTNRLRTEASGNLADAAIEVGARFVQESVVTVYADGGEKWIDENHTTTDEDLVQAPLTAERHALRAGGVGVRFGFFYGSDSSHTRDEIAWARRGLAITIGDPDDYYPDVHLDDAARAVVAALDAPTGVYNVTDDEPLRRRVRAEVVAAAVGRSTLRLPPAALGRVGIAKIVARSRRVSNARFKDVSGWRPVYPSFRDGFPEVVREVPWGPSRCRWLVAICATNSRHRLVMAFPPGGRGIG
jgi:2-alkyl-3-oxoalkanoate reductase